MDMRTTEEILALQEKILNSADGRNLTDGEVTEYETLDTELKATSRTTDIRNRDRAYRTPAPGQTDGYHGDMNVVDSGLDRAFENYLRTGQPNADMANLKVSNAQSEGTSTAGGYTVPAGFRQKLVEVQKAFGGLASLADSFSTGDGRPVEYPTINDTANKGDITPENTAFVSGADLVFDTVAIGAYKYTAEGASGPLKVSVELAQDSAFNISDLVARKLGERIARKEADHWTQGNGVGQPLGIVAPSLTANETLDVGETIDYDDIMDLYDTLDAAYEPNAKWVMKKNTWSIIRGIVDNNGRPLVQDALSGIGGAPQKQLLGFEVVFDETMPSISGTGVTMPIALGDFREAYVIRRVAPLVVVVNPWSSASTGQVEYTAWERADGTIQNRSAYVIVKTAS